MKLISTKQRISANKSKYFLAPNLEKQIESAMAAMAAMALWCCSLSRLLVGQYPMSLQLGYDRDNVHGRMLGSPNQHHSRKKSLK